MNSNKRCKAEARREALAWMRATWPAAFTEPPKPLAVGVHRAIQESAVEAEIQAAVVKAALATWCNRMSYLRSVAGRGHRVTLDGAPGELVTPEQSEHARQKIRQQQETGRRKRIARQQQGGPPVGSAPTMNAKTSPPMTPQRPPERPKLTLRKTKRTGPS